MTPLCRLGEELSGSTLLCLGAHSDDIEIGCGGTVAKIVETSHDLTVCWVVFTASGIREDEARHSAAQLLGGVARQDLIIKNFRNGFFPYAGAAIKEFFESLKAICQPDLIFTHCRHDLHQDHRVVSELTWNTFRNHRILEYEIPKYDGDLGSPNAFMTLTEEQVQAKTAVLENCFQSQRQKPWFTADTFRGLCRLRGVECASPTGYAEGFYARKVVLG